jgi:hypothetical protein
VAAVFFLTPLFLKVAKWQSGKVEKWQSGKVAPVFFLTPLFKKVAY